MSKKSKTISVDELREFLSKKTKVELIAIGKELKIKRLYSMRKAEVIEKIIEVENKQNIKSAAMEQEKAKTTELIEESKKAETKKPSSIDLIPDPISKDKEGGVKKFENVEFEKFEEPKYPGEDIPLPTSYNDTKIIAIVKDPEWVYCYWEIDSEKRNEYNLDNYKLHLRVYDITAIDFDGTNSNSFFDIEVNPIASNWYVKVESEKNYCIDLGFFDSKGNFVTIVRSNYISVPRLGVSSAYDEEWMTVEEIFKISTGYKSTMLASGSFEIERLISKQLKMALSSEALVTSGAITSSGVSSFFSYNR